MLVRVVAAVLTLILAWGSGTLPFAAHVGPDLAAAQVTPIDDEPDDVPGLGRITGSPDAGPLPEDAGDRGGWAQLGLALVLVGAIGFIVSRIVAPSRAAAGHRPADPPEQ